MIPALPMMGAAITSWGPTLDLHVETFLPGPSWARGLGQGMRVASAKVRR